MIADAEKYKESIRKVEAWLSKGVSAREASLLKLERCLFLSFFYIRKLIEAQKLSTSILTESHTLGWHPITGLVDALNWHRIDELVNLSEQFSVQKDLEFICNRFVHSFIFVPCINENQVDGILIATDRDRSREQKLFRIPLPLLIELLRRVGEDTPSWSTMTRGPDGQLTRSLG